MGGSFGTKVNVASGGWYGLHIRKSGISGCCTGQCLCRNGRWPGQVHVSELAVTWVVRINRIQKEGWKVRNPYSNLFLIYSGSVTHLLWSRGFITKICMNSNNFLTSQDVCTVIRFSSYKSDVTQKIKLCILKVTICCVLNRVGEVL